MRSGALIVRAFDHQHAVSCRRLWQSVAVFTITDAAAEILKVEPRRKAWTLHRRVRYFQSRDWELVCTLAGVSCKPGQIEAYLRSDRLQSNRFMTYSIFGVREGATNEA